MGAGVGAWKVPSAYFKGLVYPTDPYQNKRVKWAIIGIQKELVRAGYLVAPVKYDGGFGPLTDRAVRDFQASRGLFIDGVFGPKSSLALFRNYFVFWQVYYAIPDNLVLGVCRLESGLDPGAEGFVNSADRGIGQFNRVYWPSITDEIAFSNPGFCILQTATNLANAHTKYGTWDCAVAAHNDPSKALIWSRTGVAPDVQIQKYVELVRAAGIV